MLLAAGCGGGPSLPSEVATPLAERSDATAEALDARRFCAARVDALALQEQTIEAINTGSVPAELQEELLGSVNALLESISCTPPRAEDGAADEARDLADWLEDRSG